MKYSKTIVCFANSRKSAGRCIAGKEWKNGRLGEWIRPVSARQTHELTLRERCYADGQDPRLLDIIRVPFDGPQPLSHQGENHIIDSARWWSKQAVLLWKDVQAWLDNPSTLWNIGEGSYSGVNNRVASGQEDGTSLYLISVDQLRLLVGRKAPEYPDSKRAVRGEFLYRGTIYRMDVTDPEVEQNYLSQADGKYDIPHPVLCISLGDPYKGYFYKLIAAVLHRERFR